MISRRLFAAVALLCAFAAPAHAQKTKAQMATEITTTFPENTVGAITPTGLRLVTNDIVNSIMPTAPVVSGNLACFDGTTGLLKDCASSPATVPLTVNTTPITGGLSTNVLYINSGILGAYSNTQLTALINLATSSLPGALPAWPNNTTTFFRGDATFVTLNCAALSGVAASCATDATNATNITTGTLANGRYAAVNLAAGNVNGGVTGVSPLTNGGTGQATAPLARSSTGLNVDQFTGHGDSVYTILATDRTVGTNAAFTASRTWTLPAANAVNAGQEVVVADFQGTVTGSNTLVITRAGSDTVNGGSSVTIVAANGAYLLKSDGISKWTAQALGAAAAGGVSSVTCGTGLSGGTITTSGTCAVSLTSAANSLSGDVSLSNTANYFDGPSTAQGTSGTWLATGTVTVSDTASAANIYCKLWDGTTVIASGNTRTTVATDPKVIALSGVLATPAANIKISCRDITSTSGVILFNVTGNSKDSTLTVVRIQ